MDLGVINYMAVVAAAVAAFVFGAVYYGVLGKPWMKAARIDPSSAKMSAGLFVTSFVAELVMAFVLSAAIDAFGMGSTTVIGGLVTGVIVWLGFMATTMAVNHRYQGFGWDLTLIDGLHWLGVALVMGAVIGWFGGAPI
jgi:uncharacterized membrane protein required for colicin V production